MNRIKRIFPIICFIIFIVGYGLFSYTACTENDSNIHVVPVLVLRNDTYDSPLWNPETKNCGNPKVIVYYKKMNIIKTFCFPEAGAFKFKFYSAKKGDYINAYLEVNDKGKGTIVDLEK